MGQRSVFCSAQPAHIHYNTIHTQVPLPNILMIIILSWQVLV